jgi:Subunit ChlI of Mg-chelatase/Magnesium chelatase, subunit ChlI
MTKDVANTHTVAIVGTHARLVNVEVSIGSGLPSFRIVGLPAASVREAEQRTRSAIEKSGEHCPSVKIVANLAPGGLRKEGTHFDLPIALGILGASGRVRAELMRDWVAVGELALDGSVRPVRGALAAATSCRRDRKRGLLCPAGNAAEAAAVRGVEVVPVARLQDCLGFLKGEWKPPPIEEIPMQPEGGGADMSEVRGHPLAKEAMEIAAAGGHNVLLMETLDGGSFLEARLLLIRRELFLGHVVSQFVGQRTLNRNVSSCVRAKELTTPLRPSTITSGSSLNAGVAAFGSGSESTFTVADAAPDLCGGNRGSCLRRISLSSRPRCLPAGPWSSCTNRWHRRSCPLSGERKLA